jgi:enoyl-CoA hydratase/carnithine racemase
MATTIETRIENGLGRLVLNHPPLNILTQDMLAEMRAAIRALEADSAVRVLLVSAHGKHFSAGADVGEHLPPLYRQMIPEFLETVAAIDGFPLPVVAAVQGHSDNRKLCSASSRRRRASCCPSVATPGWPQIWCCRGL